MKKLIFLLIVFLPIISLADSTLIQNESVVTPIEDQVETKDIASKQNIESVSYYKLLYENSKESNSKLLSLLTAAMVIIIAVILAIIGSSFFYNYRFNKKEYELLTKENINRIEEAQKKLLEASRTEIEKISENNKKEIEKKFTQISETYRTNFETIKDSIKTIVTSFKQSIDENLKKQSEAFDTLEKQVEQLQTTAQNDIKVNEKNFKIDILEIKAELYFMKEWYSLALSNFVDQGLLCVDTSQYISLIIVAPNIIKSIEKVIERDDTITISTKLNIEKLLTSLPNFISIEKKKIEETYKKIKIKEIEIPERGFGRG
jgi:hypothetical protein